MCGPWWLNWNIKNLPLNIIFYSCSRLNVIAVVFTAGPSSTGSRTFSQRILVSDVSTASKHRSAHLAGCWWLQGPGETCSRHGTCASAACCWRAAGFIRHTGNFTVRHLISFCAVYTVKLMRALIVLFLSIFSEFWLCWLGDLRSIWHLKPIAAVTKGSCGLTCKK